MQLPATLITLPVIVFVFATKGASMATIVFAIYVFVAGLVDNVLKPLLLGRGVDVPMPVILIGALGGMVTSGIIGLFIGPVVLAVGYQLFWQWVEDQPQDDRAGRRGAGLMRQLRQPINVDDGETRMLLYLLTGLPVMLLCLVLQAVFVAQCLRYYARFKHPP